MKLIRIFTCLALSIFAFSPKISSQNSFQQAKKFVPGDYPWISATIDEATPPYALEMYKAEPNMQTIERLHQSWKQNNPDKKDDHTRNYKHLRAFLESHNGIASDGSIKLPTVEERMELHRLAEASLKNRSNESASRSMVNNWQNIGPDLTYYQGVINDEQVNVRALAMAESDNNRMYAGTATGAIFRSDDKAVTWYPISESLRLDERPCIAVHPTNKDLLYVGEYNKMYKSADGGMTWTSSALPSGFETTAIAIDKSNTNNIYASGYKGLLKSTDAGLTWASIHPLGGASTNTVRDVRIKTNNTNTIFAIVDNTTNHRPDFYKSTNGGTTWTATTNAWWGTEPTGTLTDGHGRIGISDNYPNFILFFLYADFTNASTAKKDRAVLLKSSDGGDTWTPLIHYNSTNLEAYPTKGQGFYDWDVEVSDVDTNYIYLGSQSHISTTNGFTSFLVNTDGEIGIHVDLQYLMFQGTEYWAATDGGITKLNNTLSGGTVLCKGITGSTFFSFNQGWNTDVFVGSLYHNGTAVHEPPFPSSTFRNFGGAEPADSGLSNPKGDRIWSTGYGGVDGKVLNGDLIADNLTFHYDINANTTIFERFTDGDYIQQPECYNIHYACKENIIYKSLDAGKSFTPYYTFGTAATHRPINISISRHDSDRWYVTDSYAHVIHRSDNGGLTFTSLPIPITNDQIIDLDPEDKDHLYMLIKTSSSNQDKIYESFNGGNSWVDISPPLTLTQGQTNKNLMSIGGVTGGLMYFTEYAVYYRSAANTTWQAYNQGLPLYPHNLYVKPFYKEGKVRIGTVNRGAYSNDFPIQPTRPIAQPTVDRLVGLCPVDTFYFDCYSMLNHTNATWTWSFSPAPAFISNINARNPKVVFGSGGLKSFTLTVNDGQASSTKTVTDKISIAAVDCAMKNMLGNSIKTTGASTSYWETKDVEFDFQNKNFSIAFWVKTTDNGADHAMVCAKNWDFGVYRGWVIASQFGKVKFNIGDGTNRIDIASTTSINDGKWHYITATVNRSSTAKLYIDGVQEGSTVSTTSLKLLKNMIPIRIGVDDNFHYPAAVEVDELVIYNKELTIDELRKARHNFRKNTDLLPYAAHYYQMNEADSIAFDHKGSKHMRKSSGASRLISNAPVYSGGVTMQTVTASGVVNFTDAKVEINFASPTVPNGPVVAFRLDSIPSGLPTAKSPVSNRYYAIDNYGTNQTITTATSLTFSSIPVYQPLPSSYKLYKRNVNEHVNTWTLQGSATAVTNGLQGSITFNTTSNVTSLSQFLIVNDKGNHWIGVVSTDWSNPLNWASGTVPDDTVDVIIPANTPFSPKVNVAGLANSVLTLGGAFIEVLPGFTLTIK